MAPRYILMRDESLELNVPTREYHLHADPDLSTKNISKSVCEMCDRVYENTRRVYLTHESTAFAADSVTMQSMWCEPCALMCTMVSERQYGERQRELLGLIGIHIQRRGQYARPDIGDAAGL